MINRIHGNSGLNPVQPEQPVPAGSRKPVGSTGQDEVQISDAARLLSKMPEVPEIRQDKVDQVRQAILRGDYETPDKIVVVVERLLKELNLDTEGR